MTLRDEFEKAYQKEFGPLTTIPCYEALWAAKWAMEKCAESVDGTVWQTRIRQLIKELSNDQPSR